MSDIGELLDALKAFSLVDGFEFVLGVVKVCKSCFIDVGGLGLSFG